MKFLVSDYSFLKKNMHSELGVYFNDHFVFPSGNNDDEIHTYKFKFEIVSENDEDFDTDKFENIEFYHTCNLNDYILMCHFLDGSGDTYHTWNYEKLFQDACPERYQYLKDRVVKKSSNEIPSPTEIEDAYAKGCEFLEFTEESSYVWAGAFEQNGKSGAAFKIKEKPSSINFPILNVKTDHWSFHCPHSVMLKLDELGKEEGKNAGGNYHYRLTPQQKEEFFNSLSVKEQHQIWCKFIKYYSEPETLNMLLPFSVYMFGNDDCSYTKWFATKEEVTAEVEYLRKMQPLDFTLDIKDRGYIFTN